MRYYGHIVISVYDLCLIDVVSYSIVDLFFVRLMLFRCHDMCCRRFTCIGHNVCIVGLLRTYHDWSHVSKPRGRRDEEEGDLMSRYPIFGLQCCDIMHQPLGQVTTGSLDIETNPD